MLLSKELVLRNIKIILADIYDSEAAEETLPRLKSLMDSYGDNAVIIAKRKKYHDRFELSERDAILITYADTLNRENEKPLKTLRRFLNDRVKDVISGVHILPFFPSSSDGGYSIIDYKQVDPRLGDWDDIRHIASDYRLAIDLVMNHVSKSSQWFQGFLKGDRRYRDYFIWRDDYVEKPEVFRPRNFPVYTKFETADGDKYVWTTFSEDQVDLNFKNPQVLLEMTDALLFYLSQGAEIIRLDAIGYVWKKSGTSCVNLKETHDIVKLLRRVLEYTAPYAGLLAEANFPYKDNVSYELNGFEANMVYNFTLPPMVVDAFAREDTTHIRDVTNRTRQDLLFFDFLASHDGIGLLSVKEILSKEEFATLIEVVKNHNGLISYKASANGKEPYELNISYFDAINDPHDHDNPVAVERFMASQAIKLSLKGVPGIYIHSLLGSRNYYKGVEQTGINRMINRERLEYGEVEAALDDPQSLRARVFESFLRLITIREHIIAFHPESAFEVIDSDPRLAVIVRQRWDETFYALINISGSAVTAPSHLRGKRDLLTDAALNEEVDPYGVYYLK